MGDEPVGSEEDDPQSDRTTVEDYRVPVPGENLESVLGLIDDAVFIFSVERNSGELSFRFQWNNAAHESITGMTIDEFGGLCPREFLGEEVGAEVVANYRKCVERRETIAYEETLEHERGVVRWHTKLTPVIEDGQVVQIVGVARDITDRMARTKHFQVVDRVFRHNIRNRLNVIIGAAQHAEANAAPPISEYASTILDSAADLLHTSEKARTITEVILEEPPVTELYVDTLLEQVAAELTERNHDADVSIPDPPAALVEGVPEISDAVVELVWNAIVHHDGPSPTIEVSVTTNDATIELDVADDGPGIPEMERAILVEGRTPDALSHGTGLGMWMVYWIVQASNGEIRVADRSPRGSVVTLRLPRRREDAKKSRESTHGGK